MSTARIFFTVFAVASVQARQTNHFSVTENDQQPERPVDEAKGKNAFAETLSAIRTAIGDSARDATLGLEAFALDHEADSLQVKHQKALQGLQDACHEQLAAKYKSQLEHTQAVSKEADQLNRVMHENAALREEASLARHSLSDLQSRFSRFMVNVSTLQDFVNTALEESDPLNSKDLDSVLTRAARDKDLDRTDPAVRLAKRYVAKSRPTDKESRDNGQKGKDAARHGNHTEHPKAATQTKKNLLLLQFPAHPDRQVVQHMRPEGMVEDVSNVEKMLQDMKSKLLNVAGLSSKMQQNVVDQCSKEMVEASKAIDELKQKAQEISEKRTEQEALNKQLLAARKHLATAHHVFTSKERAFEDDAWTIGNEAVRPMVRLWADSKEELGGYDVMSRDEARGGISLLQVGAQMSAGVAVSAEKRRHRPSRQMEDAEVSEHTQRMARSRSRSVEPSAEADEQESTQHQFRTQSQADEQVGPSSSEDGLSVASGTSMQTVAARVAELQQRLSQMDMENKQALERAKYVYERKLNARQSENRALAESNQQIVKEIQDLAQRRHDLRSKADALRRNVPAWKSDLSSLAMNFTTALEVTHKALATIETHSTAHAVKILDALDRQDKERDEKQTKLNKLQEIMAASHGTAVGADADQPQDGAPHEGPVDAPAADAEIPESADEEGGAPLALLQTSMLSQLQRAASSRNPSALLQALDSGLADLTRDNEVTKEEMKRRFQALLENEVARHESLLKEHRALEAKLHSSQKLNQQLEDAIHSLMDFDKELRSQAQSLRAFSQQLGIRALPVAKTDVLIEQESQEPPSADMAAQEQPSQAEKPHQPVLIMQTHTASPKKASAAAHTEMPPLPSAAGPQKGSAANHWLSWLTR